MSPATIQPEVYVITGHGESSLDSSFQSALEKNEYCGGRTDIVAGRDCSSRMLQKQSISNGQTADFFTGR